MGRGRCLNRRCMQVVVVLEVAAQVAAEAHRYTQTALCIAQHYAVQRDSAAAVVLIVMRQTCKANLCG